MTAPLALQAAIVAALSADIELSALIGSDRIFDRVPRTASPPYIAIASTTTEDWSTGTERGDEHVVILNVWSDEPARAETARLLARIAAVLDDQPLTVAGHRLVSLRHERSETRRRGDGDRVQGIIRLRARTERAS